MQIPRSAPFCSLEWFGQDTAFRPFGNGTDHKQTWLHETLMSHPTGKGFVHEELRVANSLASRTPIDRSRAENALASFRFLQHQIALTIKGLNLAALRCISSIHTQNQTSLSGVSLWFGESDRNPSIEFEFLRKLQWPEDSSESADSLETPVLRWADSDD